jgi:alkanesulfonate monooxygenase SsuD/methylene tetrahydromethanopterin reductase-like flavin-dependent oxidoreductase (luciferase family)
MGTIVLSNTFRHPAVLAKMAAQIDIVSRGRLVLGLGAGWHPGEHEAYGIPFPSMRERLERLDEACRGIRSLWTEGRSTFDGQYYQLSAAPLDPKPVQTPHPPLMIGGGGERVTLRLVAAHADACNFFGGPKVFARKCAILDQHCAAIGRDPKTIRRTASMFLRFTTDQREIDRLGEAAAAFPGNQVSDAHDACLAGTPEQIRERLHEARAASVDTVFIPTVLRPLPEIRRDLDRFITEIAPEFR